MTDIGKGNIYTVSLRRNNLMESKLPGMTDPPHHKERGYGYVRSTEEWELEAKE